MTNDINEFTEEEIGNAYIFLNDLKSNKNLKNSWNARLEECKSGKIAVDKKMQYINNFLADNGYQTSAGAVLNLIKTPWWNEYVRSSLPNKASDAFVQSILQDSKLFYKWTKLIEECTKDGSLDKANQFLEVTGYHCSAQQVNASFEKMRNHRLAFWAGIYGITQLVRVESGSSGQKQNSDAQPAAEKKEPPVLVVYGDSSASVGGDELFEVTYKNGQLTWPLKPLNSEKYPFNNPHSGSLTFSEITHPKEPGGYVGHFFSGMIVYGEEDQTIYQYSGELGRPSNRGGSHSSIMPHRAKKEASEVEKIAAKIGPYLMIGFAISLIVGGLSGIYKLQAWVRKGVKEAKAKWEEKKSKLEEAKDKLSEAYEKSIEDTDEPLGEDIAKSEPEKIIDKLDEDMRATGDPQAREQMEEKLQEQQKILEKQNEEEQEYEEENSDDVSEESETVEILEEVE